MNFEAYDMKAFVSMSMEPESQAEHLQIERMYSDLKSLKAPVSLFNDTDTGRTGMSIEIKHK